jgi:hypothetical protein
MLPDSTGHRKPTIHDERKNTKDAPRQESGKWHGQQKDRAAVRRPAESEDPDHCLEHCRADYPDFRHRSHAVANFLPHHYSHLAILPRAIHRALC